MLYCEYVWVLMCVVCVYDGDTNIVGVDECRCFDYEDCCDYMCICNYVGCMYCCL